MPCGAVLGRALPCGAVACRAALCRAVPYPAVPCHAVLSLSYMKAPGIIRSTKYHINSQKGANNTCPSSAQQRSAVRCLAVPYHALPCGPMICQDVRDVPCCAVVCFFFVHTRYHTTYIRSATQNNKKGIPTSAQRSSAAQCSAAAVPPLSYK